MIKGKHERLKEVYAHVRAHCGIHTQSDFASALKWWGRDRSGINRQCTIQSESLH